jgi:hypothetical protein
MRYTKCDSSALSAYRYDEGSRELSVVFKDHLTYKYLEVEPETYEKFLKMESRGKAFNQLIKPYHQDKYVGVYREE